MGKHWMDPLYLLQFAVEDQQVRNLLENEQELYQFSHISLVTYIIFPFLLSKFSLSGKLIIYCADTAFALILDIFLKIVNHLLLTTT